jgi:hypothetical protein
MSKKLFCFALCAMLFALSFPASAQQTNKVYRIGYLTSRPGLPATGLFVLRSPNKRRVKNEHSATQN